jgi:hypothetical protein
VQSNLSDAFEFGGRTGVGLNVFEVGTKKTHGDSKRERSKTITHSYLIAVYRCPSLAQMLFLDDGLQTGKTRKPSAFQMIAMQKKQKKICQ